MFISALLAATWISGVNPELHTFNNEGECGTGAVVPWAGSLWAVSYGPHLPNGSSDLLYEIRPDFTRVIHRESVGGTPADRMIHRESNQLLIGPYLIDAEKNVRVIAPSNMPGRLTAAARHLKEPANKVYYATMDNGLYEVDIKTLAIRTLVKDDNGIDGAIWGGKPQIKPTKDWDQALRTQLPGSHTKGMMTGFGRIFLANNGEYDPRSVTDPWIPSGVLGSAAPDGSDQKVIRRCQFTDVTTRNGIYGNESPEKNPVWAIGWDVRSVILAMTESGGDWRFYRLPKGSHSYDGAHGWNTEWPRIREIGEGDDFLMTMHGTFWHFPATMSFANSAGIKPRSNYLKVIGDFCRWGDKVVLGCDDTAANEFFNKRKAKGGVGAPGQSNSSLWFVDPADLDTFGPVIGRGAVWYNEDVKAGTVSDPYLLDGYDNRTLYVAGRLDFEVEVDEKGDGNWQRTSLGKIAPGVFDLKHLKGSWIRLIAKEDAPKVTAFFNYANIDRRPSAKAKKTENRGILRSAKGGEKLPLEYAVGDDLYVMLPENGELKLAKKDDAAELADFRKWFAIDPKKDLGDGYDEASAVVTDDNGRRWRFPYATKDARPGRLCRECCTERDLLNLAGVIYELPAENAGGFAMARAVSAPGEWMYDYCTWRGLFIISGIVPEGDFGRVVNSDDGRASLWIGVADDLWRFGKPVGVGGPWKDTVVKAGVPSDPFIMTGFDSKYLSVSSDCGAKITIELDITGTGVWIPLRTFKSASRINLSDIRAYWLRAVADRDCKATVQLEYR